MFFVRNADKNASGASEQKLVSSPKGLRYEAYRMLVLHVNAHAVIEGETAYAAFIDYANTEIEHFKQEVLGGGKKGKSKTDGVEE